jgi:hypothetical protein
MTEINLTQIEADFLLDLEKMKVNNNVWDFPTMGMKVEIPLTSLNKKENFLLDISRGTIDLKKIKFQNRARQVIILARVDISGSPHRNPDGSEISATHIHRYVEGFGDKWAYPIPEDKFHNINSQWDTLYDFMNYCNITQKPEIRKVMF